MNYAERGKRSRAWWLRGIKMHETKVRIAHALEVDLSDAKEALDSLNYAGMIKLDGAKNVLTSLGHRYLNEHQDELAEGKFEVFDPRKAQTGSKSGSKIETKIVSRPVPAAPVFHGPPEPQRRMAPVRPDPIDDDDDEIATDFDLDGPGPVVAAQIPEAPADVTLPTEEDLAIPPINHKEEPEAMAQNDDKPLASQSIPEMRETLGQPEKPADPTLHPDAKEHARSVLADLLIERFGDQITAKDLVERL